MTTNPKRPRQSFKKYPMNRAGGCSDNFQRRIIQEECYSGNSLGKKGTSKEGVLRERSAVTWSVTACQLGELTDKFRIYTESEDWYLTIAAPSSSQGDQSKLRGPEELLFERSPGVGMEERPPIAVVVQVQEQVLPYSNFF